ncbi:Hypp8115 [Branchiostoma lanceolatum]|uniref:Hypp8115 protein n=1 Tax=Branchiostoma lanceolatum TaxID=7740 RepID=A0A8J9Z7E9_BRALA|nr:Hypp8115 [Branchiostoma lanceolatum]
MATSDRDLKSSNNLYSLLGVTSNATEEEIISAYGVKVKRHEKAENTTKDKRLLSAAHQTFSKPHTGSARRRSEGSGDDSLAEIVIIGDSNTRGIIPSVLYPGKQTAKHPAMKVPQATDLITTTTYSDPKCIVFHVGTNDIREERAAHGVTETSDNWNDQQLMEVTRDVNAFLHILNQETSYTSLADNNNLGEDGFIKASLFKRDGYHLNRAGLKVLAASWKTVIHPIVGMGTYHKGQRRSSTLTGFGSWRPHDEQNPKWSPRDGPNPEWLPRNGPNPGWLPRDGPNPDWRPRDRPNPDWLPRNGPDPGWLPRDGPNQGWLPRDGPNQNWLPRSRDWHRELFNRPFHGYDDWFPTALDGPSPWSLPKRFEDHPARHQNYNY